MRFIYLGDVVGRAGREAVLAHLPLMKESMSPDIIVVNAENAAGGFGVTQKICEEFYAAGVSGITLGNHAWDQKETQSYISQDPRLVRPINYPEGTPGRGYTVLDAGRGRKFLIVQAMGRVFMDPLDDPFAAVDGVLKHHPLGRTVSAVLVDLHGEATSEKMAMGHFCDGRASLVCGTHSHIPTGDAQILPNGTAYQTDAGMCGDYDSVIGMNKEEPIRRFTRKISGGRYEPALGEGTACGVFVETDDKTGLATRIDPIRLGARLKESLPTL